MNVNRASAPARVRSLRRETLESESREVVATLPVSDMFLFMRPRSVTVPLDWATVLIVLSGLPGTGKTTVARELARQLVAVHLRIDSIEQSIRDIGRAVEDLGYRVAYAVAEDNLRLGHIVVADCVNPWPLTRSEWRAVAERTGAPILDVEIVCSDPHEHRRRVETRAADIVGHTLPTWKDVIERDYRPWNTQRTVVDTARLSVEQSVRAILGKVRTDRAS